MIAAHAWCPRALKFGLGMKAPDCTLLGTKASAWKMLMAAYATDCSGPSSRQAPSADPAAAAAAAAAGEPCRERLRISYRVVTWSTLELVDSSRV